MNTLNTAISNCLQAMKESSDFSDRGTTEAIHELLSCIISSPKQLINNPKEENLSLVMSSIMTSSYPSLYPILDGLDVRNVVFVCAYYLYMHQLDIGYFYDRNWPAFILLMHLGRQEFAKFSVEMNPFAPEKIQCLMNKDVDSNRALNVAKGVELNMMLAAKKSGFLTSDLEPWFEELYNEYDELLADKDPFRSAAIPLYQCISNYLKEDDLTFVKMVK